MFDALKNLLRGRPTLIKGAGKLPEGQAKKIDLGDIMAGGRQVVLCRVDGELCAVDALCPHEGGRISDGPLHEGKYVMCPLHNFQFDPKTGRSVNMDCKAARTYKVREKDGDAELWT
jgi:nitrite reductase/ring-hydroxylating ferredoxin subunit